MSSAGVRHLPLLMLLAVAAPIGPAAAQPAEETARLHDTTATRTTDAGAFPDLVARAALPAGVDWAAVAVLAAVGAGLLIGYRRVRRVAGRARQDAEKAAAWAAQDWLKSHGADEIDRVLTLRTAKEIERIRWHVEEALERLRRHEADVGRGAEARRLSQAVGLAVTALVAVRAEATAPRPDSKESAGALRDGAITAAAVPVGDRGVGDWLAIGAEALAGGRVEAAVDGFSQALRIAGGTALDYARSAAGLGLAQLSAGRSEPAAAAFARAEAHVRDLPGNEERRLAASGLLNRGEALRRLGRAREALDCLDSLVVRFGDDPQSPIRAAVVDAMIAKAIIVAETEGPSAAIAHYDAVVGRFGDDPEVAVGVAEVLVNKGLDLADAYGPAAAMAVYEEVVTRFGEALAPSLHEHVVRALLNKGVAMADVEGPAAALAVFDAVIHRCTKADDPALRAILARALVNRGLMVALTDGSAAAVAAYDDVIRRFGEDGATEIREQVANAMVNKGVMVARAMGPAAAVAVCDEAIRRFGRDPDPPLREPVAKILFNKAASVARIEGPAAAGVIYEELIFRFGADAPSRMQEIVVAARGARDHLRGAHGTPAAA